MASLYLLIPIALFFVVVAVAVFYWAVNSGQFDDLDTESQRIFFDEDDVAPGAEGSQKSVQSSPEKDEDQAKAEK